MSELQRLKALQDNEVFLEKVLEVKLSNKRSVATYIKEHYGIEVLPESMFDIHVKRIHEYKRQLMNILHVVTLYNRIKKNPTANHVPRTVIFGGKVSIIHTVNSVGYNELFGYNEGKSTQNRIMTANEYTIAGVKNMIVPIGAEFSNRTYYLYGNINTYFELCEYV